MSMGFTMRVWFDSTLAKLITFSLKISLKLGSVHFYPLFHVQFRNDKFSERIKSIV